MAEVDSSSERSMRPHLASEVEQAEWDETRVLAESVILQIGYDHSTDDDNLWEANWYSEKFRKNFELSRESDEEGVVYWLEIRHSDGYVDRIGFDPDFDAVSYIEGEEGEEIVYDGINDPNVCRAIEIELKEYLRSAPIDHEAVPSSPVWERLFSRILVRMAAADPDIQRLSKDKAERLLKTYYALSDEDVKYALSKRRERRGKTHGNKA